MCSSDLVGRWPLQPRPEVVRGFDPPDSTWGAGHRGVDLLGVAGAEVHAALAGRVSFVGLLAGRGVVVVDHGTTRTTYEPVTPRAGLAVGSEIAAGAVLGVLGVVGSHCPPAACLHWGWIRNVDDVYLDPLGLVGGGPIRLLPLTGLPLPVASTPGRAPLPVGRLLGWTPPITALAVLARIARVASGAGMGLRVGPP